jgi:hypothetical protein
LHTTNSPSCWNRSGIYNDAACDNTTIGVNHHARGRCRLWNT